MTRALTRRMADALGRHIVRTMPAGRAYWAAGMQAEIEAIDEPGAALAFALGCLRASYGRRLRTLTGALTAARWSVTAGTLVFSSLVLANARWAMTLQNPEMTPQVLGGLGLAFLVAGLALIRFGPGALAAIAGAMLVFNTGGLWVLGQTTFAYADLYRALVLEGYLLWSGLLLTGLALHHAGRSPRLGAFVRARGWDA